MKDEARAEIATLHFRGQGGPGRDFKPGSDSVCVLRRSFKLRRGERIGLEVIPVAAETGGETH